MAALIPTPVTLEDLINEASDINTFNNGVKTQLVSPRTKGVESILVAVTDDPISDQIYTGTADANVLNSLSDSSETESWFRNLLSETGIPDILVNSASEFLEGGYVEMSGAELTRSMNLELKDYSARCGLMSLS